MEQRSAVSFPADAPRPCVYILPTRYGCVFAVMLLVMLLGSINYSNSLGYALTFLLGGMVPIAMVHTHRNIAGMRLHGANTTPSFAGDAAYVVLQFDNVLAQARYAVAADLNISGGGPERFAETRVVDICANQAEGVALTIRSGARGYIGIASVKLSSHYPLGLFYAWTTIDLGIGCYVYPRPGGRPLASCNLTRPGETGTHHGQPGGPPGADDFSGFRYYRPGDPPRYIAWKALARDYPLLVKNFSGGGSEKIILDWQAVSHFHDHEKRLSQLCRWVLDAAAESLSFALLLPGREIGFGSGQRHVNHCLRALALYPE